MLTTIDQWDDVLAVIAAVSQDLGCNRLLFEMLTLADFRDDMLCDESYRFVRFSESRVS